MESPYCFITVWLLVAPVLAQTERSRLEASIPPAKLDELISSRQRARQELYPPNAKDLSPQILRWFLEPGAAIATVKLEQVIGDGDRYMVNLAVEKVLRGAPPARLSLEAYWREEPWPLSEPVGAQRIRPITGKRMLASLFSLDYSPQSKPSLFVGILDLDRPEETAYLPSAIAAAKMEVDAAVSGTSVYELGLRSEDPVVHEMAMRRLIGSKDCPTSSHCRASVLSEIGRSLGGSNPIHRMDAVRWLDELSEKIRSCQLSPCTSPGFDREPVRRLLQSAVQDKNLAVGDRAFEILATLDFAERRNAGYCEEIIPALRKVEQYPFGGERWMGGRLSAASTCVGPARK